MLESLTILNQGGLILYQYRASPSLVGQGNSGGVGAGGGGSAKKAGRGGSTKKGNKGSVVKLKNIQKSSQSIISQSNNNDESSIQFTQDKVNGWIEQVLLGRNKPAAAQAQQAPPQAAAGPGGAKTPQGAFLTEHYQINSDQFAVALYPDVFFDGPRAYLKKWVQTLLQTIVEEYDQFFQYQTKKQKHLQSLEKEEEEKEELSQVVVDKQQKQAQKLLLIRPDPKEFDDIFFNLLNQSKSKHPPENSSSDNGPMHVTEPQQQQLQAQDDYYLPKGPAAAAAKNNNKKEGGKQKRTWNDGNAKVTKEAMAALDYSAASTPEQEEANNQRLIDEAKLAYLPTQEEIQQQEEEKNPEESTSSSWIGASFKGILDQMTGNKILTKQDLKLPLQDMHKLLTSKNVANEVATQICNGVETKLIGKRLNSFYRVSTAIRQSLEDTIAKLLTPSKPIHLLKEIQIQKQKQTSSGITTLLFNNSGDDSNKPVPYTIVVVGINGVGKSTSLAKLAYYLKSNGCQPLLAACDTFRSGAVEQLSVHAKCLDIPIYSQGYSKDPSQIAKAAIKFAQDPSDKQSNNDDDAPPKEPHDVVLIDTAGRMQNNVPLMKALGKLVHENKPNLVLLVTEALVGNDGTDQLRMFNKAILQQQPASSRRAIDAIILTKFDTVSDKVGAALTMTQVTDTPILFVGTGQKYHHLQPLSVQHVINSLFK